MNHSQIFIPPQIAFHRTSSLSSSSLHLDPFNTAIILVSSAPPRRHHVRSEVHIYDNRSLFQFLLASAVYSHERASMGALCIRCRGWRTYRRVPYVHPRGFSFRLTRFLRSLHSSHDQCWYPHRISSGLLSLPRQLVENRPSVSWHHFRSNACGLVRRSGNTNLAYPQWQAASSKTSFTACSQCRRRYPTRGWLLGVGHGRRRTSSTGPSSAIAVREISQHRLY